MLAFTTAAADFICPRFHESSARFTIWDIVNLYKRDCLRVFGNYMPIQGYIKMSNQTFPASGKVLQGSGMSTF